jgi:hypothetical protein|tara:strand:- start:1409 stop:1549 length:141 start_codon:yes stop_codon:yes gene_type:complete
MSPSREFLVFALWTRDIFFGFLVVFGGFWGFFLLIVQTSQKIYKES